MRVSELSILRDPLACTVIAGDNAALSVVASGSPPLTLKWYVACRRFSISYQDLPLVSRII